MDDKKEIKIENETEIKTESQKETKENKKEKKITKEDKLREEVARLERELKEEKETMLREIAEMQTTKRRLKEAEIENRKYAAMNVISELVNPIDMLVRVVNGPAPSEEIKNYQIGFQMIANQLVSILEKEGLKDIVVKEGDAFNPKVMEALNTEESDVSEPTVTKIMQKGYMFKDRVLKPTLVNVAIPVKVDNKEEKENE